MWRDVETALRSTQRLMRIAREQRALVHVLHVTTEEEIALLAQHKDIASVEVTPHHLTMDSSEYKRIGTLAQMNPPVREARHRDGLWRGVAQGVVDVLGSDHAPHTLEEKAKPYPESPSGMTGVQTLVPLLLDHVNAGPSHLAAFRRLNERRRRAALRPRRQGPRRRRLRCGFDDRGHEASRDDPQFMDRLARRLDAL